METLDYIINHWDTVFIRIVEHIEIIAVGNGIGVIVGVIISIAIASEGREGVADVVLYFSEIMMTVPSLALFGLMIPLLSTMYLPAIGFLPAVIALILYGLLPILQNTYTALKGVDRAMIEAGRGMGMTERQILFRVKLPLAVPVIMAGLRTAIVINIGIAAIAAFIGAGGLGTLIFRGIRNFRVDLIFTGAIFVSILAIAFDGLMGEVEKWVTPKGIRIKGQLR
jgi:osmoprotectant transport system permease protein